MSKVITQDNEQVIQIYNRLKDTLTRLEDILKNNNPTFNGHRYMNDAELANYLKVSRRTLQEYRNNGILSYYQIGGKILYRESDIEELLEKKADHLKSESYTKVALFFMLELRRFTWGYSVNQIKGQRILLHFI